MSPDRRTVLRVGALATASAVAGCNGSSEQPTETAIDEETTPTTTTQPVETETDATETAAVQGCVIEDAVGGLALVRASADGAVAADAERQLRVRWNARLQPSMDEDPDDFSVYTATRGTAYLVYRLELTNRVDREISVAPHSVFGLRLDLCEATWYEEATLFTLDSTIETRVSLQPGETATGVMPFEVPRQLDRGTLVRYSDPDETPDETFVAECDRTLQIGVGTQEE